MEKVGRAGSGATVAPAVAPAVGSCWRCEVKEEDKDEREEDRKEEEEEEEGCCCCCCCSALARLAARFLRAPISFQKRVSLWRMES